MVEAALEFVCVGAFHLLQFLFNLGDVAKDKPVLTVPLLCVFLFSGQTLNNIIALLDLVQDVIDDGLVLVFEGVEDLQISSLSFCVFRYLA